MIEVQIRTNAFLYSKKPESDTTIATRGSLVMCVVYLRIRVGGRFDTEYLTHGVYLSS